MNPFANATIPHVERCRAKRPRPIPREQTTMTAARIQSRAACPIFLLRITNRTSAMTIATKARSATMTIGCDAARSSARVMRPLPGASTTSEGDVPPDMAKTVGKNVNADSNNAPRITATNVTRFRSTPTGRFEDTAGARPSDESVSHPISTPFLNIQSSNTKYRNRKRINM